MGINSRQTYRLLKQASKRWFKQAGFRPKGQNGLWIRPHDDSHELHVMFQCDKYGWDWDGSRFTLNFDLVDLADEERQVLSCRYGALLDQEGVQAWISQTNRVVEKLRRVEQPPLLDWEYPEERDSDLAFVVDLGIDPWMRFYDEGDIEAWWELLEPRMEGMIRGFFEHGGDGDLPNAVEIIEMPGITIASAEKQPGDLKTPTLITLPRSQAPRLLEVLDEFEKNRTVMLRDGERYLVWKATPNTRSGRVAGFSELGLSGRSRASWVLGAATVVGLRNLLLDPADGPREIVEVFGKVPMRSWILVQLT